MQRLSFRFRVIRDLVLRYTVVWVADAVSIAVTAFLLPGIYFLREDRFWYLHPFTVALLLGLLNALVRPVLIILLLPITFVTLGLATLALNAALFYFIPVVVDTFVIESFGGAVVGLLVLTLVNTLLGNLIKLGDDYSFYSTLMNKFSTLTRPREVDLHNRGLLILQIDGLAYGSFKRAIKRGKMPFLNSLLKRRRHVIRKWFSGLPSQTSAVQTGIFYGSSYDVPGFRWYNKREGKMIVSSSASDLRAIDERMGSERQSILESGTCISTLVHGNANKKILTASALSNKDIKHHRGELEDFAIFSLHPYLYTRTILFMLWDFLVDRFEAGIEFMKSKKPRLVRSVIFSLHRAIGNACFREMTSFFVREDIVRGIPIIFANFIGYDMVAHYAGPDSRNALSTLTGIDRRFKHISRTIRKKARKHFDMIILSDHGQTRCVSFSGLYGKSLEKVIQDKLEHGQVRHLPRTGELAYFDTLLREMRMVEDAYGTIPIRRGRRTLERLHARIKEEVTEEKAAGGVVVCPSGNLAHVYFTEVPERLRVDYLMEKYATLIEYLVSHPGIGFLIATNSEGELLMMGKGGMRKLRSGEIDGEDPLAPYTSGHDPQQLVDALVQMSSYPSAGDLILNGTILPDRTVVSFENQRGTHGGLGGQQTEPFIIYPRRFRGTKDQVQNPVDVHNFIKELLPS
ncbi:MAG: phage holin family protein [Candidatus Krumholzibacteria bacterium]